MKKSIIVLLAFAAMRAEAAPVIKCGNDISQEPRITCLLKQMTLDEKVTLLSGTGSSSAAIPRLGIPAMNFSDGSHGVRTNGDPPTTDFPGGISIAATFNPELVQQLGAALGEEARANDVHVLLGPAINIQRFPLGGRNFEYYTEDPYLDGVIGTAWVRGVQSEGVGASLKHFAANNQELNRAFSDSVIDERTLREIYLAGFEKVVRDGKPWTVMASYNRVNGLYATENSWLLRDILKGEWGYDGLVMSDWGAVHSTVPAINAGTDLEMPTPLFFAPFARGAVDNKQIEPSTIDDAVRRLLRLAIRTGVLDGRRPVGVIGSPAHLQLAERIAEQSIVLLKNDAKLLPLSTNIHKIALIGPNVYPLTVEGGGSSQVDSTRIVSVVDAVRAQLPTGADILYLPAVRNDLNERGAGPEWFSIDPDHKQIGLKLQYFQSYGDLEYTELRPHPFDAGVFPNTPPAKYQDNRRVWTGFFWADRPGEYHFSVTGPGDIVLSLDGAEVISGNKNMRPYQLSGLDVPQHTGSAKLAVGAHKFFLQAGPGELQNLPSFLKLGVEEPTGTIEQAVAAAKSADVAVVMVGDTPAAETEGADRDSIDLYGQQNDLVKAVLAANPHTVVVVNAGGPITMSWINQAHAVIDTLYPGQEGATALARILFGVADPSGRLPETFPLRLADNPAVTSYPNDRQVFYGEGVFVGYRWYDKRQMDVLFPFGHGLSYTSFGYGALKMPTQSRNDTPVQVSATIANTGTRVGAEVVQLYVAPENAPLPRPVRELKNFTRINLAPGTSQNVSFVLSPRDFSYWDTASHKWVAAPGKYLIELGSSSRDIRLSGEVTLTASN